MAVPIALIGSLFTLALLLGGEIRNALGTGAVIAALVVGGRYVVTQRTRVWLNASDGTVRILRTTMFDEKRQELLLDHLESAEVEQRIHHDSGPSGYGSARRRATSTLQLVFNNTRPATRVPLTVWAVSGCGNVSTASGSGSACAETGIQINPRPRYFRAALAVPAYGRAQLPQAPSPHDEGASERNRYPGAKGAAEASR